MIMVETKECQARDLPTIANDGNLTQPTMPSPIHTHVKKQRSDIDLQSSIGLTAMEI